MRWHVRAVSGCWLVAWAMLAGAQDRPPAPDAPPPAPENREVLSGKPGRPPRENRPQVERNRRGGKMLEQVMLARLSEELNLSDEQTVIMVRRFMDFRNKRNDLRRERENLMKSLRDAIDQNAPDPQLEELLNKIRGLHEALVNQQRALYEELSRDLAPRQRAKLFLFLERFEAEVQQMLRGAAEQRLGPPFTPHPGLPHPPADRRMPGPAPDTPQPPANVPPPGPPPQGNIQAPVPPPPPGPDSPR